MNKPGVEKGVQTFMMSSVNRIRPYAYMHCHKLHNIPTGWTIMGQVELRMVMVALQPMVEVEKRSDKNIYREHYNYTWDNYFSGDIIMDWFVGNSFALSMTCRRYRLPADITGQYLHKKKTDSSQRINVDRFLDPAVTDRSVDEVKEATTDENGK